MDGRTIIKILRQHGFVVARVRGSHHIMTNGKVVFPVPVHGKRDLSPGTLRNIEKASNIKLRKH